MDEAVDQGDHAGGVGEDLAPFGEGAVGGDQRALLLVAAVNELEQQIGMTVGIGEVADLIESCRALHDSIYVESAFMWSDLSGLIAGTASRVFDST